MNKKYLLIFLLNILGFIVANAQAANNYKVYTNRSGAGLCSSTFILFNDSTYCNESGCEASSRFSFGKWRQVKNNIQFTPLDPNTYNFISKVEKSRSNVDSIKVIICDRNGNNISGRVTLGLYVKNVGMFDMKHNEVALEWAGIKRQNSSIQLLSFMYLFKQSVEIPVSDSANVYKVYLNFVNWNFQKQSIWDKVSGFSLIKKKGKLVSSEPDAIGKDGYPVPSEYIEYEYMK